MLQRYTAVCGHLADVYKRQPVYIVVMFIPEMLCSLEVDYISAILLPCEDIGQGDFVPLAAVILVECLIFTGSPPAVFHVESGGRDLRLCQICLLYTSSLCVLRYVIGKFIVYTKSDSSVKFEFYCYRLFNVDLFFYPYRCKILRKGIRQHFNLPYPC